MKITDQFVFFYTKHDLYSQHSPHSFKYKGVYFKTAEHFMMFTKAIVMILGVEAQVEDAIKFMQDNSNSIFERILNAKTPQQAKMLGRDIKPFNDPLWCSGIREETVYIGSILKFQQNKDCYEHMKSVGNRKFVEASERDKTWGIGLGENDPRIHDPSQWNGLNLLGKQLDKVNDILFLNPRDLPVFPI